MNWNQLEKDEKHYYGIEYPTKDKNTPNSKPTCDIIIFL